MKNFKFTYFLLISLFAFVFTSFSLTANAQETETPPAAVQDEKRGARLFQLLNLSPEQLKQIRAINLETREQIRAAVQKQRDARRALDSAIYADNANAAEVEQRARAFAEAQAELSKMRARTEFRIRQVLTAEQLARFRDLRRRAAERIAEPQEPGLDAPRRNRQRRLPLKNRPPF